MSAAQTTSNNPTPVELARLARQQRAKDGIPTVRMNPVEKALANPNSKALAIRAMCYQCVGGELAVQNIRNCSSGSCPLYAHRPYQVGSTDEQDLVEIQDVTDEQPALIVVAQVVEPELSEEERFAQRMEYAMELEEAFIDQERILETLALQDAYYNQRAA